MMNKIKQTEQNLDLISRALHPRVEVNFSETPQDMLKITDRLLNSSIVKQPLAKHFRFQIANQKVQTQLQQRQSERNTQLAQLQTFHQTLPDQFAQAFETNLELINSLMQKVSFDYFALNQVRILFSFGDRQKSSRISTRKTTQQSISKLGRLFLDEHQQQIYKIFDTKEQIYFLFKNEMDLAIKHLKFQEPYMVFREDKDTFEAVLVENHTEEETNQNDQQDQQEQQVKQYSFTFLNTIVQYSLNSRSAVPPVLMRQFNCFLIFKEIILTSLDYLHIDQICHSVILQKDQIQSDYSEHYNILPSSAIRENRTMLSTPQEASDSEINSESKVRQVERKVKNLVTKIRRIKRVDRETSIDQLCIITFDQLKDYKVEFVPSNSSQQAQRNQQEFFRGNTNKKLPAGTKQHKGLDKISKADQFLKRKGQTQIFHPCWLEMRGFQLVWYHEKTDKEARGLGLLDDSQIKDEGLVNNVRLFTVKLQERELTFKVDKQNLFGANWRKVIANKIAYKSYLNTLWLHCRMNEASPQINLIDYFFDDHSHTLNVSNNSLQIPQTNFALNYTVKYSSILFDSILNHSKLETIILRNSKLGPIAVSELIKILQDKRIHNRVRILDISNCCISQQTIACLADYLMNRNSFGLNELYLDQNNLGDIAMIKLAKSIKDRYTLYWDASDDLIQSNKRHMVNSRAVPQELELIRLISIRDVGMVKIDFICEALEVMIKKATDFRTLEMDVNKEFSEAMSQIQNQSDQYTKRNLHLIRYLYDGQDAQYHGLIQMINLSLDISQNPVMSLQPLVGLIKELDCFRILILQSLEQIQPEEIVDLIKNLESSLSLEFLDIRENLMAMALVAQILEAVSLNYSINLFKLSISKENEQLLDNFEGYQFYISDY